MYIKRILFYGLLMVLLGVSIIYTYSQPINCELELNPIEGECELVLKVTNSSSEELTLEFSSGQKYDFIVKDPKGENIWQWSEAKMFMQMVEQLNIVPDGERIFTEKWQYTDKNGIAVQPGIYIVQGILTTSPKPIKSKWIEIEVLSSYIEKQIYIEGRIRKILNKLYLLAEDGIAYHIEDPSSELYELIDNRVIVTSYIVKPIPGMVDKKIIIKEYEIK